MGLILPEGTPSNVREVLSRNAQSNNMNTSSTLIKLLENPPSENIKHTIEDKFNYKKLTNPPKEPSLTRAAKRIRGTSEFWKAITDFNGEKQMLELQKGTQQIVDSGKAAIEAIARRLEAPIK